MKSIALKIAHARKLVPESRFDSNELVLAVWTQLDGLRLTDDQQEHIRRRCSPASTIVREGARARKGA